VFGNHIQSTNKVVSFKNHFPIFCYITFSLPIIRLCITVEAKTRAGMRVDFLSTGRGNRAAQSQPKPQKTRMGRSLCYAQMHLKY